MFNPQIKEVTMTLKYIADKYSDYLQSVKVEWKELKDEDGDVYQIVPIFNITYK